LALKEFQTILKDRLKRRTTDRLGKHTETDTMKAKNDRTAVYGGLLQDDYAVEDG
jgi:hypothetical protein